MTDASIFSQSAQIFDTGINVLSTALTKTKNINHIPTKNLTTISGIVNCESLGVLGKPVALKEDLNVKANINHTHDINDIVMNYEEEESFTEEEAYQEEEDDGEGNITLVNKVRIVNKTKTISKEKQLEDILSEKANSSHTHALADITDYSTIDLSQYFTEQALTSALSNKANVNHTHTLNDITDYTAPDLSQYATRQSLNASLSTKANMMHDHSSADIYVHKIDGIAEYNIPLDDVLSSNQNTMTTNANNIDTMASSVNTLAESIQDYIDTLDNSSAQIEGDTITFTANLGNNYVKKSELATSVSTAAITLNGNDLETALSNKANSSHTHTLSDITNYSAPDLSNCAKLDQANTFSDVQTINGSIVVSDASIFSGITCSGISSDDSITSTSTITGTNVLSNNETRLAACETALNNHNHDGTYAKLGYDNTFTGANKFTYALTVPYLYIKDYNQWHQSSICMKVLDDDDVSSMMMTYFETGTNAKLEFDLATVHGLGEYKFNILTKDPDASNYSTTYSLTLLNNIGNSIFPGTISTPAITLNGTDLATTLNGKASSSHSHAISDITNLQSTLNGKASSSHSHAISDITNLQSTLNGKASSSHSHAISDITNLQSTLDGKASSSHTHSGYASSSHSHAISDITNLQTTLNGKASSSHSHAISDITNLQTTLNGKASSSHTHSGYASSSHTHTMSDITDFSGGGGLDEKNDFNYIMDVGSVDRSNWGLSTYGEQYHRFVVTNNTSTNYGMYSDDGIQWKKFNFAASRNWKGLAYGEGKYVAIAGNTNYYGYSSDGINWSQSSSSNIGSRDYRQLFYGKVNGASNGYFVAVAYNTNYGAYSTTGTSWSPLTMPSTKNWITGCFGYASSGSGVNGMFLIFAWSSNYFAYSYNGTDWSQLSSLPSSSGWNMCAAGNGRFLVVQKSTSTAAYSTDGLSWTSITLPYSYNWQTLTFGDGKFVLLENSGNGRGMYSTDCVNWTLFYTNRGSTTVMTACIADNKLIIPRASQSFITVIFLEYLEATKPIKQLINYNRFDSNIYQFCPIQSNNNDYAGVFHHIGYSNDYNGSISYHYNTDDSSSSYMNIRLNLGTDASGGMKIGRSLLTLYSNLTSTYNITCQSLSQSSDRRLKEDINEIPEEQSVNVIDNLKVYSFYFKERNDTKKLSNEDEHEEEEENIAPYPKKIHYGVIAQELQQLAPELVGADDISDEHYMSVNYIELIPHLINKIHAQDKRINDLEQKLNLLLNEQK